MTLAENELRDVRSVSGIIPEVKRSGIVKAHNLNNLKVTIGSSTTET